MPLQRPYNGKVKIGDRLRIGTFAPELLLHHALRAFDGKTGTVTAVTEGEPPTIDEKGMMTSCGTSCVYDLRLDTPVTINDEIIETVPVLSMNVTLLDEHGNEKIT